MSNSQDLDKWRRPESFLADVVNKSARGDFRQKEDNTRIWYRATVIAVDVVGDKLENPNGSGELEHIVEGRSSNVTANIGPSNPKNSIKARIITDEIDQFIDDEDLRVFWPMMPEHDSVPIKPGEHAYVTFEDEGFEHGLWLGKVSGHQGVNYSKGESSFTKDSEGALNNLFLDDDSAEDEEASTDVIAGGRLVNKKLNNLFKDSE